MELLMRELAKVDRIVTKLAANYPDKQEVWTGNVSDRLQAILNLMQEENENGRR